MRRYCGELILAGVLLLGAPGALTAQQAEQQKLRVEVGLPAAWQEAAFTGRVFLFIAHTNTPEPRLQPGASLFGQDVRGAKAGARVVLDERVPGCPQRRLGDLAAGDYYAQVVLNIYTDFHRADGHVIWAHEDHWEGQNFAVAPGNYISPSQALHRSAESPVEIKLQPDQRLPPREVPADTAWVQRLKFQSPLLTRFWGRPIYLGATVLLPKDYAAHPEAQYPVIYLQGHFSLDAPFGFSPAPEKERQKSWARQCEEAAAQNRPPPAPPPGKLPGALSNKETGHEFYEAWTADHFPRVIVVTLQHPTPYFDDSYGINSPNCGPYGDAILQELIPAVERRFRIIRQPYARLLTGSSTGGWGALALQLYHPDFFGGAWAFSPDPVDFRLYYGGVNIYEDDNAFSEKPGVGFKGGGLSNRRGSQRTVVLGRQDSFFEWWKHTPCGPDGYPLPVWDPTTGKIDHAVARQMREQGYDLRDYLARNWGRLGLQLVDKLHICAAETDMFYSNLAVHLFEDFMQTTSNPRVTGSFQYGPPGSNHGWQPTSNAQLVRTLAEFVAAHQNQR